jgi:conjugative transposon TraN protein
MKKISAVLSGILLFLTVSKSFSQDAAGAKASFVQPYHLSVTYSKTTNLVFPYPIKSVDRGSRDILIQKPQGIENVLQLKAAKQGFPETNLTVVTSDGNLFSYVVNYAEAPSALSILFQDGRAASRQVAVFTKDATTDEIEKIAQRVGNKERTVENIRDEDYRMQMSVKGIYIHNDVIYFQLELKNNSPITYDVQSLRFSILDKKRVKRTATQETDMQPLYVLGNQDRVRSSSEQTVTVALPKFTIAGKKYLNVELMEKNGGRNLSFRISNKDLMRAKPI